MPTHVMTSFRDSIAFSSVILSGLSSDVCFFMSAVLEERESLLRSRKAGGDGNHGENGEEKKLQTNQQEIMTEGGQEWKEKEKEKKTWRDVISTRNVFFSKLL